MMTRALVFLFALLLAGCGGGSDSAPVDVSAPAPVVLSGVAASGAAIAGRISLKDAAGHEQFVDTTDGHFSFALAGLTAPFMLKAQWTVGGLTQTLYSFAASSNGGTANITPLTQLAVVSAAGTSNLDAIYAAGDATTLAAIATALPAAVALVEQSLQALLAGQGVGAANPISDPFLPDHTGMDAVLDGIAVSYASGVVTVADKASGALLLEAPIADLSHAVTTPDWTAQQAALAADPDVAVAANGDGLVVWSEIVGGQSVVEARGLVGNISAAVVLSLSGDAAIAKLAFDDAADAMVVWTQFENGRNDIWARRYANATQQWGAPVRISSASALADANVPDVAVDAAGNAIAVWHQGDGRTNHFDVQAARYDAVAGNWSAPFMISDGIDSSFNPRIAMNGAGQGIAAWTQQQGDGTTVSNGPQDIAGRSVGSDGTLGSSTRLNAVTGDVDWVYGQVDVAVDASGNGFTLWVQGSGTLPFVIHAARFAASPGWQTSRVITDHALDNSYGPHLAFDASGNAVAIWQQQTGVGAFAGFNRFDVVAGWGVSGNLGDDVPGDVYDPHIAVDGAGNATAVWYQQSATDTTVMMNRAFAGGAWGASRALGASAPIAFTYPVPRVAANAAGRTLTVVGTDSQ
jgi:hypothetical protein